MVPGGRCGVRDGDVRGGGREEEGGGNGWERTRLRIGDREKRLSLDRHLKLGASTLGAHVTTEGILTGGEVPLL